MNSGEVIASALLAARGTRGDDLAPYGDGDAAGKIVAELLRTGEQS